MKSIKSIVKEMRLKLFNLPIKLDVGEGNISAFEKPVNINCRKPF